MKKLELNQMGNVEGGIRYFPFTCTLGGQVIFVMSILDPQLGGLLTASNSSEAISCISGLTM